MSVQTKVRAAINKLKLSKSDRLLIEEGVIQVGKNSGQLVLTEQGRRIILDYIWDNDKTLREAVAKAVEQVREEEKEDC